MTPRFLFRYRSTEALLRKHQELEHQQIYFASPAELNDPMEGYRDVFWLGDDILWSNLFRHYILCLLHVTVQTELTRGKEWKTPMLHPAMSYEDLPTEEFKAMYRDAISAFFQDESVSSVLDHLVQLNVPLSGSGLVFHLRAVHLHAIRAIFHVFVDKGLRSTELREHAPQLDLPEALKQLGGLIATMRDRNAADIDKIFAFGNRVQDELAFIQRYNGRDEPWASTAGYLMIDFPKTYATSIADALIHPGWFAACFSENCTNASMWGTYSEGHKGVALKFNVEASGGGEPGLTLHGIIGYAGRHDAPVQPIRGDAMHAFKKVKYSERAPEIDFFRFLGQLPRPVVDQTWACDPSGRRSGRLSGLFSDMDTWRRELWQKFDAAVTTKHPDWAHEQEHRLTITDTAERALRYPFKALAGIVFGVRTSISDKHAIAEVIERKCSDAGRTDFEFSQAEYSRATGGIEVHPMTLLRF